MNWIEIFLLMAFSGAFGGILDVLRLIDVRKLIEQNEALVASKRRFFYALGLGGIIGSGGGFAMLLLLTATSKLSTENKPENILFLLGLGVVSGFLGYTLLKGMAERVKEQVGKEIGEKVEESAKQIEVSTNQKIETTERRIIKHAHEAATAITKGFAASDELETLRTDGVEISDDEKQRIISDAKNALASVERVREQVPDNRTIGIISARIYRGLGEFERAIAVLSDVLLAKAKLGTDNDRDAAALLYNRSCYFSLLAELLEDNNPTKNELIEKAYENLERALSIPESSSEYSAYAVNDDDLKTLHREERFQNITSKTTKV